MNKIEWQSIYLEPLLDCQDTLGLSSSFSFILLALKCDPYHTLAKIVIKLTKIPF